MTIYFMFRGCGFHWQLGGFDVVHYERVIVRLSLYWRNQREAARTWALSIPTMGGLQWRERSPRRRGAWILRGPWEKVSDNA